jgi:hypothetical protein
MRNMTQIFAIRSQNTGFALDRQLLAHWLASKFNMCGVTRKAEKISRPDQKKGG